MTSFQVPPLSQADASATEDPMELTSEMERRFGADDDTVIDIDITGDGRRDGEDEYMEEDIEEPIDHTLPNEHDMREPSDAGMVDEGYAASIAEQASMPDEDIEDAEYVDLDVDEDTRLEATLEQIPDPSLDIAGEIHEVQGSTDDFSLRQPTVDAKNAPESGELPDDQQTASEHGASEVMIQKPPIEQDFGIDTKEETSVETPEYNSVEAFHPAEGEHNEPRDFVKSMPLKTEMSRGFFDDNELDDDPTGLIGELTSSFQTSIDSHLDVGEAQIEDKSTAQNEVSTSALHSILVEYEDKEFLLFQPVDQGEESDKSFFLQDTQLMSESISELLGAIGSVLGPTLGDDQDITISIDSLDLAFSESSPESLSTTLAQVSKLHNDLFGYDGIEPPPHLYINLNSTSRLFRRLGILRNAVGEGKGLSQLQSYKVNNVDETYDIEEEEPGLVPGTVVPLSGLIGSSDVENCRRSEAEVDVQVDSKSSTTTVSRPYRQESPLDLVRSDNNPWIDVAEAPSNDECDANTDAEKSMKKLSSLEEKGKAVSPPTQLNEQEYPVDDPVVDEGDFVDYEDDEDPAGALSSRSSTLQGDAPGTTEEQDAIKAPLPMKEGQDSSGTLDLPEGLTKNSNPMQNYEGQQEIAITGNAGLVENAVSKTTIDSPTPPNGNNSKLTHEDEDDSSKSDWNNQHSNHAKPSKNTSEDHTISINEERNGSDPYKPRQHQEQRAQEIMKDMPQHTPYSDNNHGEQQFSPPVFEDYDFGPASLEDESIAFEEEKNNVQTIRKPTQPADAMNEDSANAPSELPRIDAVLDRTQVDEDEITYEDEIDTEPAKVLPAIERAHSSSPGCLKRVRSFVADDDMGQDDPPDAKRVRS